jgi:C-terminal processing protease CtpA/Prc
MRFDDGSALKYTEAEYYTYGGTDINGVGVEPDIYIEDADEQYNEAFNYLRDKI